MLQRMVSVGAISQKRPSVQRTSAFPSTPHRRGPGYFVDWLRMCSLLSLGNRVFKAG